jgi:transcriptional regulator with XRE-family HTH domain
MAEADALMSTEFAGMITKEELGTRIRLVRKERGLTLKELERVSGFSATHISEIERGKTSPTIGALVRISSALGKDTSYFLEEEQLNEVAVVRRDERQPLPEVVAKVKGEYLTPGIPGGRLNAYMITLEPGDQREIMYAAHAGEEGVFVIEGRLEVRVGDRVFLAGEGDTVHYPSDRPHGFRNVGQGSARILLISTKRVREKSSSSGTTGRVF